MTTTFITGANKSLGFETARRLVEAGHTVLIGARDPQRGQAAAESLGARFVHIDVTDDASVQAAAADVAAHEGKIDVLVNNAGVLGRIGPVEQYTAAGHRRPRQTGIPCRHRRPADVRSGLRTRVPPRPADQVRCMVRAVPRNPVAPADAARGSALSP